jgi:hypothetical protein
MIILDRIDPSMMDSAIDSHYPLNTHHNVTIDSPTKPAPKAKSPFK